MCVCVYAWVCVCAHVDGNLLMHQSDYCSTFLIHYFPSVKSYDEDPEEEALIACTYCVNNGIVLETSPPSRLPVSHAGGLSSVFAISSHSMQLLRSPSRDATSGRKQTYLPESSWWGLVLTLADLKINTAVVYDNCAMKQQFSCRCRAFHSMLKSKNYEHSFIVNVELVNFTTITLY